MNKNKKIEIEFRMGHFFKTTGLFLELNNFTMKEKIYDFEERLVRLAGEIIFFTRMLKPSYEVDYYKHQIIRSSGSAALNYGEAQATVSKKDFIHKVSLVSKELKETQTAIKILQYIKEGQVEKRNWLLSEISESIKISSKMILNKKN